MTRMPGGLLTITVALTFIRPAPSGAQPQLTFERVSVTDAELPGWHVRDRQLGTTTQLLLMWPGILDADALAGAGNARSNVAGAARGLVLGQRDMDPGSLVRQPPARVVHEHAPHGLRRDREELAAALPVHVPLVHQPEIGHGVSRFRPFLRVKR